MKKILALLLIAFLAMAAWISIDANDMVVTIGDQDFDGPLGALLGTLIAGGAMAFVAVVLTCVAVLVGCIMAGVGVLLMLALSGAGLVVLAALSPLMLPVLIPLGIFWWIKRRKARKADVPALPTPA